MITTFTMKSFNTYAIRLNIMKTSYKILQHFFIYYMFTLMKNSYKPQSITSSDLEFTEQI